MPKDIYSISDFEHYEHVYCDKNYYFSGHRHYCYEINYLIKGTMETTCEKSVYTLSPGDYIIFPSQSFHRNRVTGNDDAEFVTMSFMAPMANPSKSACIFATLTKLQHHLFNAFIMDMEEKQGFGEGPVSGLAFHSIKLLEVLFESLSTSDARNTHSSDPQSAIYNAAVTYMMDHIDENISLMDVARACKVCRSTIIKIFQQYTSMGCMQFFEQLKLNKAKKMLESGMNCYETSEALSFSSQAYFSRRFKLFYGISPSNLKKSTAAEV